MVESRIYQCRVPWFSLGVCLCVLCVQVSVLSGSSSSPMPSPSRGHPNSHSSSSKGPSYSQQRSMTSSDTSNTIHVSGGMLMMSNSSPSKMMMPPSESHSPSISSYNLGTPSSSAQSPAAHQTLAELKKARSQTRITSPTSAPSSASSGPPSATAINQSLSSGTLGKPPVLPEKPASKHAHGSNQNPPRSPPRSARDSAQHRNSQKNARQRSVQGGQEGVSKYSSDDPGEVVGGTPVKKHGCCTILWREQSIAFVLYFGTIFLKSLIDPNLREGVWKDERRSVSQRSK